MKKAKWGTKLVTYKTFVWSPELLQQFKYWGAKGGKKAASNMTQEQLSARGKKAVKARELKRKNNLKIS